jgi:hypothetical protein
VIAPGKGGSSAGGPASPADGIDRPTLVAITVVAFALANLAVGLLAAAALCFSPGHPDRTRIFLWLSMTVNLLQAAGYWLFSGTLRVGRFPWLAVGLAVVLVFVGVLGPGIRL